MGSGRRKVANYRTTQTQNKRTQTSMPRVGFEPTIPVFERAKTVHALDRAVTPIGLLVLYGDLKQRPIFMLFLHRVHPKPST
jgi:hypothetical protein